MGLRTCAMLYLFLDETYRKLRDGRRFIIGCMAVPQSRWNDCFTHVHELDLPGKEPRAHRVNAYLGQLGGLGVLAFSDVRSARMRRGEIDGTGDIPRMSRMDNLWSMCLAFAVAKTLMSALVRGNSFSTVDTYYDPKSLKGPHREALEHELRDRVGKRLKELRKHHHLNLGRSIRIRRIEEVPKAASGTAPDKLQTGTGLAHRLCGMRGLVPGPEDIFSHVKVYDNTSVLDVAMEPFYRQQTS